MCLMQDDGKAMQAFRPGHTAQVVHCSKMRNGKLRFRRMNQSEIVSLRFRS